MGYDHWKTTNPDDEFLGPEPCRHCGGTGRVQVVKQQRAYYGPDPEPVFFRTIVVDEECVYCGGGDMDEEE